jgi:ElaB/YqjD/DUF883 family membrane-anchored ribosome-binding protein
MQKVASGEHPLLDRIMDDVKKVVLDGRELLKTGAEEAKRRAVSSAQATDRSVRSHPYQSLGIIFGLGLLVGLLSAGIGRGRHHHAVTRANG